MRESFKGWRRKVGCLVLVMACVLVGGWIRSRATCDLLEIAEWDDGGLELGSNDGYLYVGWMSFVEPGFPEPRLPGLRFVMPHWSTHGIVVRNQDGDWFGGVIRYDHKMFAPDEPALRGLSIHYSLLTTPLTILSAYLILWKPRKVK
jgi:hypothetical protein